MSESMKRQRLVQSVLIILLCVSIVVALSLGRYTIPLDKLLAATKTWLFDQEAARKSLECSIIFKLRLPRVLLAALCGMALSVSGAVLQGVFRNPLVGPNFIGISSGAAFGAVSAILLSLNAIALISLSFAGGVLSLLLTLAIAGKAGSKNVLSIILGGIVSGAFFSALVSIVTYMANPRDTLPVIVYWLMGSFNGATTSKLYLMAGVCIICFLIIFRARYVINLLALGDEDANALGVNVVRLRIMFLLLSTLVIAASVSVSGTIGWVGLIVPHIARMLSGADYRSLLITSALTGAIYMAVADILVRVSPWGEVPIGILSALVGAPILAYLLQSLKITR